MQNPTNKVDNNAVFVVRTNSHCKEEVVHHVQQKSPWLCPYFYPCPTVLWISFQLENISIMEVNTDWKCLKIFILIDLKGPLNWLKNKITKIEKNFNETNHVSDLGKNATRKINALARVAPYMSISKRGVLMNAFFKLHFNYCPLVRKCHSRININRLHERCLRIYCRNLS